MSKRTRADSRNSLSESPELKFPSQNRDTDQKSQAGYKYTHLDESGNHEPNSRAGLMQCALAPHRKPITFGSAVDYEDHYRKEHVNRCSACHRNLPTEHFLDLHISENHDPIRAARQDRGERTYRCFVEDCDRVCSRPHKRRMHLIDKHQFPKNYDFFIVNNGVDGRTSMLRSKKSYRKRGKLHAPQESKEDSKDKTTPEAPMAPEPTSDDSSDEDSDEDLSDADSESTDSQQRPSEAPVKTPTSGSTEPADRNMDYQSTDELAKSMSALRFVPDSVRFGRGRGGFAKR